MKNTTAQKVDPDKVEMASGYRMKTRPAPMRHSKHLVNGRDRWSKLQVGGEHRDAHAASDQPTALLSHVRTEKTKAPGEASSSSRFIHAPRRLPSGSQTGEQSRARAAVGDTLRTPPPAHREGSSYPQSPLEVAPPQVSASLWPQENGKKRGRRLQRWTCQGRSAGSAAG